MDTVDPEEMELVIEVEPDEEGDDPFEVEGAPAAEAFSRLEG